MHSITLPPITRPFVSRFTPPGSKSLTNRALILAALADGTSTLSNGLFADDTLVMIDSLQRLGFQLDVDQPSRTITVHGKGGQIPNPAADLFCGNSGTSIRFLTALCALGRGTYRLDGIPRMRQRPIGQLVDLLNNFGARIEYEMDAGFAPLRIHADGLAGGIGRFGSAHSSQFLSAVLQVCPFARNEVQIDLDSPQTSWPYVAMTMQLMDHFGVTCELLRDKLTGQPKQVVIPRDPYRATDYPVEPDASNASYFLAAAAIHPGSKITLEGLGKRSLQGDVGFADLLHQMGADLVFGPDFITIIGTDRLEGIDVDLSPMPDMAQTLAVTALFAQGETTIRGLHTLRLKETDRIAAIRNELVKFGATVTVENDTITIEPPDLLRRADVDTYDDHRMAMSFALAATKIEHTSIRDPQCVNKTYPEFFDDLKRVVNQTT